MNYLKLIQYLHEREETEKYSPNRWEQDYINICDLTCGGLSVHEVYQDKQIAERRM